MKSLLVITLFFTASTFTEVLDIKLVCDTPYVLTPDYSERVLTEVYPPIEKKYGETEWFINGSWGHYFDGYIDGHPNDGKFTYYKETHVWDISKSRITRGKYGTLGYIKIDRYTLEMTFPFRKKEPVRQCRVVKEKEFFKELKKAQDWAEKKLEERKI